ncbi:flagellar export protein FliJ [Bacillus suaedae]|uniref:Flagellar FliJ protein n=1 Tax=Halalkalibacter suaedae TaxID=2822140 RepID=A0A940WTJ6_9BACI|nr:flagellar export protein FliJ [Bacillus suaedae]MBP3952036.1 flagellar export protein FliJ [Bacillus suaedae]
MSFQFTLQKVLEFKENEKNKVQAEYQQAINYFEKVGTELYELLKHKEEIETYARDKVQSGTSIYDLQLQQHEISRIQTQIVVVQKKTQHAREAMMSKQEELLSQSIEYKKYDKMKQRARERFEEEEKKLDLLQMNELSIRSFVNR